MTAREPGMTAREPGMTAREPGVTGRDGFAQLAGALPPRDPVRPQIRRAVFSTMAAGIAFSVLTGPVKQVAVLYDHAPWLNDPYDTAVSFSMFFAPLVTACCLTRLPLCRAAEPLPAGRVRDLLRGCRLILVIMTLTLLAEWASVAAGANRPHWNWSTWLQVGLLALLTALGALAIVQMRRIVGWARRAGAGAGLAADWAADAVAVAGLISGRLGPLHRPAGRVLGWADRRLLAAVRRHPVWAAGLASGAFAAAAGGWQAYQEGYAALAAVLTITLLACGMFAFLVAAGCYLGLIRGTVALAGVRRRALDAVVVACFGLLVVLALRNSLWWIVGSTARAAGIPQIFALLGLGGVFCFAVCFAAESVRSSHRQATGQALG